MNGASGATGYVFVSCDIVGHSGERLLALQWARVAAINGLVRNQIAADGEGRVVWASGGDGGHVAFEGTTLVRDALAFVIGLRLWSSENAVPLRVVASYGEASRLTGADGRPQLVGHGINLAGRLLAYGDRDTVLVTKDFRELVVAAGLANVRFHDESVVDLPYFGPQEVCLLSVEGAFESQARAPASRDDRGALEAALDRGESALEALYRAKRLLQVDPQDPRAGDAVLKLAERGRFPRTSPDVIALVGDPDFGGTFIRAAQLLERRQGDLICRVGDEGTTMFLVLRGELGGFAASDDARRTRIATPDFVFGPGDLVGELAFALRRPRTATIWCLHDTALLAFSVEELIGDSESEADRPLREALGRVILRRIVEHVARTAPYLAGPGGPLAETEATWSQLRRNAGLVSLRWQATQVLERGADPVLRPGVYILVRGELVGVDSGRRLSGTDQPLVYVDVPQLAWRGEDYTLDTDEVTLLALRADDLLEFGPRGFGSLVARLREEVERAGGEPAPGGAPPAASGGGRSRVFVSYAHEDDVWRQRLQKHLQPLLRAGTFEAWDDTKIPTGARWLAEIERELATASVAVLLVSGSFLASRFIVENEMPALLRAEQTRGLRIVWVPISASNFDATELGDIQAAHDPERPLDGLRKPAQEKVLAAIARTIAEAAGAAG